MLRVNEVDSAHRSNACRLERHRQRVSTDQRNTLVRILCLSDLHGQQAWYAWVLREAGRYDLITIAGDLVDMFRATYPQLEYLREQWLPAFFETGSALAACSGNHDVSASAWLSGLHSEHRIVGDGQTGVIATASSEVIVTTIPYLWNFDGAGNRRLMALWERGSELRRNSGAKWLVLHHEPPQALAPAPVTNQLEAWIKLYRPDYVSSGHFHAAPAVLGRFAQRIGGTVCFNGGQSASPGTLQPHRIVLDLGAADATWMGSESG